MKNKKYKTIKGNSIYLRNRRAGFTLIEALVAIAILTISIAGPITMASKGLSAAMFARDQITAFYLAQEAVEYIRNIRDANNIKGENDWLKDLGHCLDGDVCEVEIPKNHVHKCNGGICPLLEYTSSTGLYGGHDNDGDSIFTRSIVMEEIEVDREASIEVTISWSTGVLSKSFTVKEYIFNWQ
jgi:prepilin-type N-terminal cleavage/methylation domain-containing protein